MLTDLLMSHTQVCCIICYSGFNPHTSYLILRYGLHNEILSQRTDTLQEIHVLDGTDRSLGLLQLVPAHWATGSLIWDNYRVLDNCSSRDAGSEPWIPLWNVDHTGLVKEAAGGIASAVLQSDVNTAIYASTNAANHLAVMMAKNEIHVPELVYSVAIVLTITKRSTNQWW